MVIAKKISEVYDFSSKIASGTATINCEKGECIISSNTDIMGIEIHFRGKVNIKPELPEGWYLRGNNSKIIIFTLQNVPIKNQLLFKYEGVIELKKVIVVNTEAKQFKCVVKKDKSQWTRQDWSMDVEADTWDNFKDITPNGKVKKTSYVIDDDLPKAEPTKKTKTKIKRRRSTGGY
tara:strand:- start:2682 stop:3212 length:531 start_codon:yes stop_codon:yes gene_type:complete